MSYVGFSVVINPSLEDYSKIKKYNTNCFTERIGLFELSYGKYNVSLFKEFSILFF